MSILIKGMKMPTGCRECVFMMHCDACEGHDNYCIFDETQEHPYWDYSKTSDMLAPEYVPEWCPLVEVPNHGRLINADEQIYGQ